MIKFDYLHKKWMKESGYRKEYETLEEEFALIAMQAKARERIASPRRSHSGGSPKRRGAS